MNTKKLVTILLWTWLAALGLAGLHCLRRVFVADRFSIPTMSMMPVLSPGDKVWVNKLIFGARIYTSFDFSDHSPLRCFRMPGVRKPRPGDVVCFNFPFGGNDWNRIEFRINYVYCKRVLGAPGDRVGAVDGHCWNGSVLRPIGVIEQQERLRAMPDSVFINANCWNTVPLSMPCWNIKDWGPIVVPAKGMTVQLDDFGRALYGHAVCYETGLGVEALSEMTEYTFQHDWYFVLGDNSADSNDSRYWGFVPDIFIIGVVSGY